MESYDTTTFGQAGRAYRTRVAVRTAAVSAAVAGLSALATGPAAADPIVCPPGQTSVQVAPSEWQCVNNGGNTSNAEDPRNPNATKGDF